MPANGDKDEGEVNWRQAVAAIGMALGIPWMIVVPALLGWWVDRRYGTSPLWFLVFLFVGLIGTALDVYKLLKRFGQFK